MARTYKRDGNGRFAGGGGSSGGGGGKRPAAKSVSRGVNRLTRDNAGKITSVGGTGATARGGRLKTAAGNKRAMQTAKVSGGRPAGTMKGKIKRDPGAAGKVGQQAKPASRKEQLAAGAKKRNAQADRIDARVKKLEGEYRGKDAAFYTQGAKPAGRDRMIAKSQQAAQLREESASLRTKAANAEKMSQRVKGTAVSKKEERRNAFDAANYKVGDTVTTSQYGTQKITKISKNSVSFDKGNTQDKAFMANYLGLQGKTPSTPNPTNAAPKSTARPLSQRETQNLGIAKSNLAISKERLAGASEAKATAKGPLEKLKATDRINEQQSNIRQINNKITAINARPAPGRPITGADRSGNRKQLSAPKKSGAIKGSIKRDASATFKLNNKSGLNAGKYKNIYMANANKAAAAKPKRKP